MNRKWKLRKGYSNGDVIIMKNHKRVAASNFSDRHFHTTINQTIKREKKNYIKKKKKTLNLVDKLSQNCMNI